MSDRVPPRGEPQPEERRELGYGHVKPGQCEACTRWFGRPSEHVPFMNSPTLDAVWLRAGRPAPAEQEEEPNG